MLWTAGRSFPSEVNQLHLIFLLSLQLVPGGLAQASPLTPTSIDPLPAVTGTPAGSLPAAFGVSETGSATYTLDLDVPPGTSGMAPKLGLTYDSQSDNSALGTGWALAGLSSITRCAATRAQDGFIDSIRNLRGRLRGCFRTRWLVQLVTLPWRLQRRWAGRYRGDQDELEWIRQLDEVGAGRRDLGSGDPSIVTAGRLV